MSNNCARTTGRLQARKGKLMAELKQLREMIPLVKISKEHIDPLDAFLVNVASFPERPQFFKEGVNVVVESRTPEGDAEKGEQADLTHASEQAENAAKADKAVAEGDEQAEEAANANAANSEATEPRTMIGCLQKDSPDNWKLCPLKKLGDDGKDNDCEPQRGGTYKWRPGDVVKFLGTCIEAKPLSNAMRKVDSPYKGCL